MTKRIIAVFIVVMMFTLMVGCNATETTSSSASISTATSQVVDSSNLQASSQSQDSSIPEEPASSQEAQPIERSEQDSDFVLIIDTNGSRETYQENDKENPVQLSSVSRVIIPDKKIMGIQAKINGEYWDDWTDPTVFLTQEENKLWIVVEYANGEIAEPREYYAVLKQ